MIREYNSKVLSKKKIGDDILEIEIEKPEEIIFYPGQYISLNVGNKIRRPYSIASSNFENNLKICLKNVGGVASKYLFSLKIGDEINYLASLGIFKIENEEKDLIFIATGTGIAPFRSIILELINKNFNRNIVLIQGARKEKNLIYQKEFLEISKKNPNFKYYKILSRPDKNFKYNGYIQDFLEKLIPEKFDGDFYICGLKDMIVCVSEKLQENGYNKNSIFYEIYN